MHSREQTLRAAAGIQKSDPNGTNYGLGGGRQPTNGKEISSAAQRGPADVHRRNVKRQESIRFKCILNLSLTWLLEFIVERERERVLGDGGQWCHQLSTDGLPTIFQFHSP